MRPSTRFGRARTETGQDRTGLLVRGWLEALRAFAAAVVTHRGFVTDDQVQAFLAAGYGRAQVLEVILGVGMKTLSNYTNHIAGTELDSAFSGRAWKAPKAA